MARQSGSTHSTVTATEQRLAKLGLQREMDLALHFPLRYEDETRITPLDEVVDGVPVQIEVVVEESTVQYRPRRQLVVRCIEPNTAHPLFLRYLNFYPSQQKQLAAGRRVRVFGETRGGFLGKEMVHPRVKVVDEDASALPQALTPVYPTTAGLSQLTLRKAIEAALAKVDLHDTVPAVWRKRLGLVGIEHAVRGLHHVEPGESLPALEARLQPAWRRIRFDELLAQQISLRKAYVQRRERIAPRLVAQEVAQKITQKKSAKQKSSTTQPTLAKQFLAQLPFTLTGAQQRVSQEIERDLSQPYPMQRLLQGDVGSGKTVIAALAALQAIEASYQAALMAPTEILAEQHYNKLSAWLTPLGLKVVWLSGSLGAKQKREARTLIGKGEAQLAIGTHALIEDAIDFAQLGVAIVDEQHRFGVRQRLALREKHDGGHSPHLLMMSATPIPRTLAMSYYADLDVSVLNELPPGRTPVLTKLLSDARRDEVIERVRHSCLQGQQAYWVCPLIEESEALQLQTALDTHALLTAALPELRVGLLHGRMKTDEKSAVMAQFAHGQLHLLVATTVIEVGVDVPNASLMVIEHAERFGLSQLHQLRGRVGRGTAESVCLLMYATPLSDTAKARLKVIYENADGFEVSRLDLELRGPGEFVGSRQSGQPMLRFANLERDADLIEPARELAEHLLQAAPQAAEAHLERWLGGRADLLKA